MTLTPFDLLVGLASALLLYAVFKPKKGETLPLPPGPTSYPLVGNLFDLISKEPWIKFAEWSKTYGSDIIHLDLLGKHVIVLNTHEAATDLMEKRSSLYSDRPNFFTVVGLMGFDYVFSFARYGDRWRSQRRLMHGVFHRTAAKSFRPHNLKAARKVLHRFLERSRDPCGNFRHMAGETIMLITYGIEVQPDNDPYIDTAEDGVLILTENLLPGANMVDFLPFLKYLPEWMPGAGFHARVRHAQQVAYNSLEVPFRAAKERIDKGDYIPSFISRCYSQADEQALSSMQEYLIKGTAASMYIAGSDTSTNTLIFGIMGLLEHPEVLVKARKEIDSVIPFGQLPTFDDEDDLPYITAICMEALRWKELLPIGLAHCLTEDDVYKGYRIPKGSIVLANSWAVLHDKEMYPDPFTFNPDRFMKDGKINPKILHPAEASFGFGRRICPGRFMALSAVWITFASLIASFEFEKSVDENGKTIEIGPVYEEYVGILRNPKHYTATFRPRSLKHEQTIRAEMDNAA